MGPEKKIQTKVVEYARSAYKGKLLVKRNQSGMYGTNGDPDYEFWPKLRTSPAEIMSGRQRFPFLIEFKAPGGEPTPRQVARIEEYRALGYHVYICDNVEFGKELINLEMK